MPLTVEEKTAIESKLQEFKDCFLGANEIMRMLNEKIVELEKTVQKQWHRIEHLERTRKR